MKIQFNKNQFLNYLEAIQKVNDIFILDIEEDQGSVIAVTADETCFLYATTPLEKSGKCTINIPDCRKLSRAIKQIDGDSVELTHTSNALKYSSKQTRFTYHLYDSDFLKRPKINPDKVKGFHFDVELEIKKDVIKNLLKNASFSDQANKIYIYTEDDKLYGEITDKQRANTDSISLLICDSVSTSIEPIILKLDNIQLLHLCADNIIMKINTKLRLLAFEFEADNNKFIYILTSLQK